MNTTTSRGSFKQRLLEHETIPPLLFATLEAQQTYMGNIEALWPIYNPRFEMAALRGVINQENDIEVLKSATSRLHELESNANKLAVDRARTLAVQQLQIFAGSIQKLLKAAAIVADELIVEADKAEDEFFTSWGCPTGSDTIVSQTAKKMRREIAHNQDRTFSETQGGILKVYPRPGSLREILAWFNPPAAPVAKPAATSTSSNVPALITADGEEIVNGDDEE